MTTSSNSVDHGPVELNVGGVLYTAGMDTLTRQPDSLLATLFSDPGSLDCLARDARGKVFIDRDGVLFRYVLDYLRNLRIVLPENFHERERLRQEAEFYRLPDLMTALSVSPKRAHLPSLSALPSMGSYGVDPSRSNGYITVGYRGTFAFGRDGLADVKFRKLSRIIVCGRVSLCREVFRDTLNESRDPDRGETDRYTSRFFLKHTFLEQAFDNLQEAGFALVSCCGTGTNSAGEVKPGLDTEEAKWQHYNEFIFERR